jgi:hypothetical protein
VDVEVEVDMTAAGRWKGFGGGEQHLQIYAPKSSVVNNWRLVVFELAIGFKVRKMKSMSMRGGKHTCLLRLLDRLSRVLPRGIYETSLVAMPVA